jgi:uncharacterized protein (TIGR01655 family)
MKTVLKIILVLVVVAVIGLTAFKGNGYYENRYVGHDYWAQMPSNQSIELDDIMDDNGRFFSKGKRYELTAYNEKGESKQAKWVVNTSKTEELYQPNTFLKISISNDGIVIGKEIVEQRAMPETALKYVTENHK